MKSRQNKLSILFLALFSLSAFLYVNSVEVEQTMSQDSQEKVEDVLNPIIEFKAVKELFNHSAPRLPKLPSF